MLVLHVGKVLTMDASDAIHAPGMLVVEDGKITRRVHESARACRPRWWPWTPAVPGFVDLHTHIHSGGFGDINDMVHALNPEPAPPPPTGPGTTRSWWGARAASRRCSGSWQRYERGASA